MTRSENYDIDAIESAPHVSEMDPDQTLWTLDYSGEIIETTVGEIIDWEREDEKYIIAP